jgi:hypothetical protein
MKVIKWVGYRIFWTIAGPIGFVCFIFFFPLMLILDLAPVVERWANDERK